MSKIEGILTARCEESLCPFSIYLNMETNEEDCIHVESGENLVEFPVSEEIIEIEECPVCGSDMETDVSVSYERKVENK